MSDKRNATGINLIMLVLTSFLATALERFNGHQDIDGKQRATEIRPGHDWAALLTPRGWIALCSEGVGPERVITEADPLRIELYPRYASSVDPDGTIHHSIGILPVMTLSLRPQEIEAAAIGDPVSLEEFIRSFGHRLEYNFGLWERAISRALRDEDPFPTVKVAPKPKRKKAMAGRN